jgi:hypothetical protein
MPHETVKTGCGRADTHRMIISEQQVQRVLEYLHSHDGLVAERVAMDHNVSPEPSSVSGWSWSAPRT